MATLDHEFERSVVSVIVDGEVSGTGVVIARGKVLTCVHVLGEGDLTQKKFKIAFYALTYEAESQGRRLGGSSAEALRDEQEVTLDSTRLEKGNNWDLAVLQWDGDLPDGVKGAKFSLRENLAGTEIYARGYPNLGDFDSQGGEGSITGKTNHVPTAEVHWTLRSSEITAGFSGGAVFDLKSGCVVGIARCATKPDENWRNSTTAIAIAVSTIAKFCGDLIATIQENVERIHREAWDKLEANARRILDSSPELLQDLEFELGFGGPAANHGERVARVIATLLRGSMKLNTFVSLAIRSYTRYEEQNASKQAVAISKLYWLVVSAILDPDLVRDLREKFARGERFLVVPCARETIVEVVLSGVEGRLASFKAIGAGNKNSFFGGFAIPTPAERGILKNGRIHEKKLDQSVCDALGISIKEFDGADSSELLNGVVFAKSASCGTVYITYQRDDKRFTETILQQIRERYPALLIAVMEIPQDRSIMLDHGIAIGPLLEGLLLPPEVIKP
jgi:hypothetical protein